MVAIWCGFFNKGEKMKYSDTIKYVKVRDTFGIFNLRNNISEIYFENNEELKEFNQQKWIKLDYEINQLTEIIEEIQTLEDALFFIKEHRNKLLSYLK